MRTEDKSSPYEATVGQTDDLGRSLFGIKTNCQVILDSSFTGTAKEIMERWKLRHLPPKQKRLSKAQKRKEIAKEKIKHLENVRSEVRRRIRETPAWERAYCSAISAIEIEIAEIKEAAGL